MSDKVYFVDSENVGARWIDLMEEDQESDFLVFYTGNSPHLDYEHTIRLLNMPQKPEFICCNEGKNALDFQLASYLGYVLGSDEVKQFVILSNDTGFDSLVRFWRERDRNIERRSLKLTSTMDEGKAELLNVSDFEHTVGMSEKVCDIDVKDYHTILNCLESTAKTNIYNAFVFLFGLEKGKELYKYATTHKLTEPPVNWKRGTKIEKFCELILKYGNPSGIAIPEGFISFLLPRVQCGASWQSIEKKAVQEYETQVAEVFMRFYPLLTQIK